MLRFVANIFKSNMPREEGLRKNENSLGPSIVQLRIKDGGSLFIETDAIRFVKAIDLELRLHTAKEIYKLKYVPLSKIAEILGEDFVQCNENFVINIRCAEFLEEKNQIKIRHTGFELETYGLYQLAFKAKWIKEKHRRLLEYMKTSGRKSP